MEEYHGPHKDHHYWDGAKWDADSDKLAKAETITQPTPEPQPTKPTAKASKPRVKSFTMIENGELIGISMIVGEPVRIDGIMV